MRAVIRRGCQSALVGRSRSTSVCIEWGKDARKVACVGQLAQVLSPVSETFGRPRKYQECMPQG